MQQPARSHPVLSIRVGVIRTLSRELPEETANVAMVYEGSTQAVMMASPADLGDFAVEEFSLSERIVDRPGEIESLEVAAHQKWHRAPDVAQQRAVRGPDAPPSLRGRSGRLRPMRHRQSRRGAASASVGDCPESRADHRRRRSRSGSAGELAAAAPIGPGRSTPPRSIALGRGFLPPARMSGGTMLLDQLIGALALDGVDASTGAVVLTSRVSVEMVQKSVLAGAPVVIAVSAPTGPCGAACRGCWHDTGRAGARRRLRGLHTTPPYRQRRPLRCRLASRTT